MKKIALFLILIIAVSCNKTGNAPKTDRAYALLEEIWEKSGGGDKRTALALADSALAMECADSTRCYIMCEKAVALLDMGRIDEAKRAGKDALSAAEALGETEAMMNLRGAMGIAYRREGKLDSAVYEYKRGIEQALKEKNAEYEIYLNNCIAVLYSENNRFKEALHYAGKAEKAALASNDTIERLSAGANIGGIYLRQKQYQKALDAMLPTWKEVVKVNYNVLTLKYLSIILKSYAVMGKDNEWAHYMAFADQVLKDVDSSSGGAIGILETKAYMLGRNGHYKEQWALLDSLSTKGHLMPDDKLMSEKAKCLSALGQKEEAFKMMYDAYALLDSVKQTDVEKSMSEFTAKYQTLEKEMQLEQVKREKAEANRLIFMLITIITFLIAVVALLFYHRKVTAQRHELYQKRNYIRGLEDERERIAKELHDGVCNDILATTMLFTADSKKGQQQLHKIWADVRHLSHDLMPPRFGHITLYDAIKSYVAMMTEDAKHNIRFEADAHYDWHSIDQLTAFEAYRIIQEAVGNAIKYGREGSTIKVSIVCETGKKIITVSNAIRENTSTEKLTTGIGVNTMWGRALTVGAQLKTSVEQGVYTLTMTICA